MRLSSVLSFSLILSFVFDLDIYNLRDLYIICGSCMYENGVELIFCFSVERDEGVGK